MAVRYVLAQGFDAIGQVRRDTALYSLPVITGKQARPAKYGDKYTPDAVAALPEVRHWVFLYGKWQWVRYRTAACLAIFLHGHQVRAVRMQFEDDAGKLSKQRLLLATRSELRAEEIFRYYARRCSIENLFNQMKNGGAGAKPGSSPGRCCTAERKYFRPPMPCRNCWPPIAASRWKS